METNVTTPKMEMIKILAQHGLVYPPADLLVIKQEDVFNLTITQLMLIAFLAHPQKMEQVYKAKNTDAAINVFANPAYYKGTNEFTNTGKGWKVIIRALTLGHPERKYGKNFDDLTPAHILEAVTEYSSLLETHHPLVVASLVDLPTFNAYFADLVAYHRRYLGLVNYIKQAIRLALWWILQICIDNSRHLRMSSLKDTCIDMNGHMTPFDDEVIENWERRFNMRVALGSIATCLTKDLTVEMLRVDGVIMYIKEKIAEHTIIIGYAPSMKYFRTWAMDFITKTQLTHTEPLPNDFNVDFDLISNPEQSSIVAGHIVASTTIRLCAPNQKSEALVFRANTPRKKWGRFFVRFNLIQWHDIFVSLLALSFVAKVRESPGRFFSIPGGQRETPPLLIPHGLPPLVRLPRRATSKPVGKNLPDPGSAVSDSSVPYEGVGVIHTLVWDNQDGTVEFQAVRGSKLCQWLAVLNASSAIGLNCGDAVDALMDDMIRDEDKRELEGLRMSEISNKINEYIPDLEFKKRELVSPRDLINECIKGDHTPRVIMIGQFHAFCVINGRIHCSSNTHPVPLSMKEIRICSDFVHATDAELIMTVHREVVRAPSTDLPYLSKAGRKRKRKRDRR